MRQSEKKQFIEMLTETLASYGKSLPEGAILLAWWSNLEQFPLRIVAMAFSEYRTENGEFAPLPAGIAKRCRLMDGRPSCDEAWAIAITSRDEADTVVWTEETAEAFAICSPILNLGDEVGARMAFKDAYNRLVSAARIAGKPATWSASLGWDAKKRDAALERAHVAGLLSAPAVQTLLPNYSGAGSQVQEGSPEGLKMVKEALSELRDGWAKAAERRAAEKVAEREAEAKRKAEIAAQVAAYTENVIPLKAQG